MKSMSRMLLRLFQNFYFLCALLFCIWVFFIDSNDLFTQWRLMRTLRALRHEKAQYEQHIQDLHTRHHRLMYDSALLERIARERYGVQKDNEEVYVIKEKP